MKGYFLAVIILAFLPVISGKMKVVDLTWTHGPASIFWPGLPPYNFTVLTRKYLAKHWFEMNMFAMAEHGGTHIDAPSHFSKGKWRLHQIPAERLIGPAVVIDMRSKVKVNPDYRVTKTDFTDYEADCGRIPEGAIVVMNSGWSSRYPDKSQVLNSDELDNPETYHFPGYGANGISWLLSNRNVSMVGVDTPSVDYGQSTDFPVHVLLGTNSVLGLENIANIDNLPMKGATIFVGAIKLFDGSGGPARILGTYDEDVIPCRFAPDDKMQERIQNRDL